MDTQDLALMIPIVTSLGLFALIAALVIVPARIRSRDRQRMFEAVRTAYERGQPVPSELIEAMQASETPARPLPERDFRTGSILVAVALAFLVLGVAIYGADGDQEVMWVMTGVAAFPGLIGLAFLAFWYGKRGRSTDAGV